MEKTNDINKLDFDLLIGFSCIDWLIDWQLWRDHRVEEASDIEKLDIDQLIRVLVATGIDWLIANRGGMTE